MVRLTYFPKGTVIHYQGIPCELLSDVPYYSETIGSEIKEMDWYYRIMWIFRRLLRTEVGNDFPEFDRPH